MKSKGVKFTKKAFQLRPKRFSVVWMLPNFLTICALIFGLQAMYQALFGNWDNVIIMIIIASVFDMLDGRVARLLKSTSEFGMHLDSLSDFVVFGAVPAFSIKVLLRQNPKIHLGDMIESIRPVIVIADGSNYPSFIKRWQATCEAKNIAFHSTAKEGSYPLN